jgi:ATP-dependent Clp protease ATP-binding subunit ClpC
VPRLELTTRVLLRELASGDVVVALAADPRLASFGSEEDAMVAARMYLAERLGPAPPEEIARFALPDSAHLRFTDVLVPRSDLPRRCAIDTPLRVTSLVLPARPDAKGRPTAWVVVVPLAHTFFLSAGEDLDEAVRQEVTRLASARGLDGATYRELLPVLDEQLVPLPVTIARGAEGPEGRLAATRKQAAEYEARKSALAVLESVAEPLHAAFGAPRPFPLRDRELALLGTLLGGEERASLLVLGPEQAGKSGLLRTYFEREREARRARYVFRVSGARLVAGMSGFGQWQARVRRVLDAAELLDAVLWFDDLTDLFADRATGSVDLPSALRPYIDDARVRVVAELRDDALDAVEARNAGFLAGFGRVRLAPMGSAEAQRVLTELAHDDARREPHRPSLTPEAIAALVELAARFFPYESFPGKAVRLAEELRAARELALGSEAAGARIEAREVPAWVALRTGVPPLLLQDDRALRVDETRAILRARVVGQEDAVRRVAELVSVLKAGLGPSGKPLATLLFVGPTGVGKTELARALAELLYGSETRMVRLDMSEYADPAASARLFLGSDGGMGLLTRRVREQPFGVVLLDEIEKAHAGVFDLLLQIAGEGRLTDGRGRTTSFENSIVIMTSNLGAAHRSAEAGFLRPAIDSDEYYAKVVRTTFRPELVNRIDRVIAFSPLSSDEHAQVARIAVRRAEGRRGIAARGIDLSVEDDALAHLASLGQSDAYGARGMRRHVERALVTPLARLVSARGAGITGEGIRVARETTPAGAGEEPGLTEGGLRFGVVHAPARRSARAADALAYVMSVRRETHRHRNLDRVLQLCDRVDSLVVELGYGQDKKQKKERRPGGELAELQTEHHRLAALRDALDGSLADIIAAEELALTGFLAGERLEDVRSHATTARGAFRSALARALVAEETDRDAALLLISELDEVRAFDLWLAPLLGDLDRRRWSAELHVDGGERGPGWPRDRRWGPPRTPGWILDQLQREERPFRSLLLAVRGDHAGMWLALEAGLQRFSGFGADARPAHLHVSLVARRGELSEAEWTLTQIDPPTPAVYEALAKRRPVRDHDARAASVTVPGGARVEVPAGGYWRRLEEVALAHLLSFELDSSEDRDAQLQPLLRRDDLAGVRAELRKGNLIAAIKVYRELTSSSLAEAKAAVEAIAAAEKSR